VGGESTPVTFETASLRLENVTLALRGRHQIDNAAVAFCLFAELPTLGVRLAPEAMRAGLTGASWPGRLEHRRWRGANVILDAAHNTAGARALSEYLREQGWTDVTLVLGVMRDKDVAGILAALLPCCRTLICTTAPSPRALDATTLASRAAAVASGSPWSPTILAVADPARAIADACRPGARVVAAGSIFLIGPLRGILR
jgi:dihydrofolate synthase/folylpolyglutamate synthase